MPPTPATLRAEIARHQVSRYVLAGRVGVHPGRLGAMLNGRLPMPAAVAERIHTVLQLEFAPSSAA